MITTRKPAGIAGRTFGIIYQEKTKECKGKKLIWYDDYKVKQMIAGHTSKSSMITTRDPAGIADFWISIESEPYSSP